MRVEEGWMNEGGRETMSVVQQSLSARHNSLGDVTLSTVRHGR